MYLCLEYIIIIFPAEKMLKVEKGNFFFVIVNSICLPCENRGNLPNYFWKIERFMLFLIQTAVDA